MSPQQEEAFTALEWLEENLCRIPSIGSLQLIRSYMEQAAQQVPEDHVPMPKSVDEARAMVLLGESWLKANAPEQLKQQRVPEYKTASEAPYSCSDKPWEAYADGWNDCRKAMQAPRKESSQ